MFDMLVRLYELPESAPLLSAMQEQGVTVRQARTYEMSTIAAWVKSNFSLKWESECRIAMTRQPVSCYIATKEKKILGFACVDVTARGFLGPMGVLPSCRLSGLGKTLLVAALTGLKHQGYAYAIIGGVGPAEFYSRAVGATPIENSSPGIYEDILPDDVCLIAAD